MPETRLIDANALKEKMTVAALGGHKRIWVCGVIDDAPTVDAATVKMKSSWIPCSERLPNNAEKCIVFMSDGNIRFGWWNAQFYDNGVEVGAWCVLYPGKPAKMFRAKNVPYWMPLPDPPRGDNGGR